MDPLLILVVVTAVIVLLFDYTNGFNDAGNIIATVIASRAMTPMQAVLIVGVFEFLGPLLGGTAVANTIGNFVELGDLDTVLSLSIVLCGLIGAIAWNLTTWLAGIPSSSTHALVGGLVGAALVSAGSDHVVWGFGELLEHGRLVGVTKLLAALLLSPMAGFALGFLMLRGMRQLLLAANHAANSRLRTAQFVTAAGLGFAHGANDAQKSMGVLTLVLLAGGFIPSFEVPLWVMFACASAMTLGILSGGWRIVRTLGFAIYRVRPIHALSSQLTSGAVVLGAAFGGMPVSTTQVVATSIMGIGAAEHPRAVRWRKAREIVIAWIFTMPGAAIFAIQVYALFNLYLAKQ
ncbi:MAG: anion permease [Betaproteobacteria bacterium]